MHYYEKSTNNWRKYAIIDVVRNITSAELNLTTFLEFRNKCWATELHRVHTLISENLGNPIHRAVCLNLDSGRQAHA
jgi:hypothetical protein